MALSEHEVTARARAIRLLLFDVDGVLTDGSVVISSDGSESKTFSIRDGSALLWAQQQGLEVGLVSGRASEATTRRARELGITILAQGVADKRVPFRQIVQERGLDRPSVAFMGDDLLDLPVLAMAGLSAAPADAADEVRAAVDWVSRCGGGRGAARDLIETILRAQGRWDDVVKGHSR